MVVTGALLFYVIPVKTYLNIVFRIKLLFLLILGTITDNFGAALNSAKATLRNLGTNHERVVQINGSG